MSEPLDNPASIPPAGSPDALPATLAAARAPLWPYGVGVGLLLLGLICFYKIYFSTAENHFIVGIFMLVAGFAEGIHAVFGRAWRDFMIDLAPALLYVLCGLIVLADPLTGSFVLTLILTAAVVTGAVYRIVASWRDRPLTGWQTLGVALVITVAVWLFLLWSWPRSGMWVLGSVAGIGLLVSGVSWIGRGMEARRAHERL